jgi:hypothetical protein
MAVSHREFGLREGVKASACKDSIWQELGIMSGIVSAEFACAVNKNRSCKNREQRVLGPRLDPPSATPAVALL